MIVKKRIYVSFIALTVLFGGVAAVAGAGQTKRGRASAASTGQVKPSLLAQLPAADGVMLVDLKRLLGEALPRVFAGDAAKLAQVNAEIDKFKKQTGIDPRSFDQVAIGTRFTSPAEGVTKLNTVALAHGTFNAGVIVAAGRLAAKGQYQEEKYKGATIYIFNINDQIKMAGLMNMKVGQLAVCALDANTLALGDLALVHEAIDARSGAGRVSNELIQLATRNAGAIIGFGASLPPSFSKNLDVPNDEIARNVAAIRQVYGSIGMTANGFNTLIVARTETAEQAKSLSETISALKQFAPLLSGRVSGAKGKLAQNALESLQVSAQGNELQLKIDLAQTDLSALMPSR